LNPQTSWPYTGAIHSSRTCFALGYTYAATTFSGSPGTLDWDKQQSLDRNKAYAFLACLLHYNLSVASTIRFLGTNYTGAYRDILSIIESLHSHGIAETLISHYARIMTMGCPNHLNVSTSCDNAHLYWRKGNHPSIRTKLDQVMTMMNKEEKNN
jgi:hypothetical protein